MGLTSASQFRPAAPIALKSAEWAANYNEIKELGGRSSTKRSARQAEDARFWLAVDGRVFYPVVRTLAAEKELSLIDSARLFALAAVARADSLIAVFDAKYHYEFWRPVTAIRNGDIDDNPATERDAAWQPIDATPMHPEYPCAHCIESASLAGVVETLFGTAEIPEVSMTSPTVPGVAYHRIDAIKASLIRAGFEDLSVHVLKIDKTIRQVRRLAQGLILGNPIIEEIRERGTANPDAMVVAIDSGAAPRVRARPWTYVVAGACIQRT